MKDQYGRKIDYMRIAVTDRCNLRCRYCMPNGIEKVPMHRILTYEQIVLIAQEAAAAGISRIKVTGGEPLVRLGCPSLIRSLKAIPGIQQVTMTTNGVLLPRYLPELLDAGLDAVNISLDTLSRAKFAAITGFDEFLSVMEGIDLALQSGKKVKINVVPQKGINEEELLSLTELARDKTMDVRFIEMMPIGAGAGFSFISNEEILDAIKEKYGETALDFREHGNGPAIYIRIPGFSGSIGFISAMHGKFCSSCNRIRLTSMGQLKSCLCFAGEINVMEHLKEPDLKRRRQLIREDICCAIRQKPESHKFENRLEVTETNRMSAIGG